MTRWLTTLVPAAVLSGFARIGKLVRAGDHYAVQAVADGAPGLIVLVREDGSLKILAFEGP